MKKLAVVGVMLLALGATAFARGHKNWNDSDGRMHNFGNSSCQTSSNHMNFKRSPELEKSSILIEEKRLENIKAGISYYTQNFCFLLIFYSIFLF